MAGNQVQMSPTALLMIHDPSTIAMGNTKDMERAITTLNEVKESIINAYAFKTGLSRNRISKLMSDETWLNAKKAVELGFADVILFEDKTGENEEPEKPDEPDREDGDDGKEEEGKKPFRLKDADAIWQYSSRIMGETILNRIGADGEVERKRIQPEDVAPATEPAEDDMAEPDDKPAVPVIGMDGRTEDGSMPYEILKDKLEWLR